MQMHFIMKNPVMNNRDNRCENSLGEKEKKLTKCSRNDRGHDYLR